MLRQSVRGNFYSNPDLMRLQTADSSNESTVPTNLKKIYELVMQYSTLGKFKIIWSFDNTGLKSLIKKEGTN